MRRERSDASQTGTYSLLDYSRRIDLEVGSFRQWLASDSVVSSEVGVGRGYGGAWSLRCGKSWDPECPFH